MKDLKPYINESLFSNPEQDGSDVAASVEHTLRLEKINNWLNSCGLRRFIDTSIKNNEIYITFKALSPGATPIDSKQMKENLYPLNFKSVDFTRFGRRKLVYFVIEDNYIQSMSDIFLEDFKVAGGGIYLHISNCPKLKDLHGCPKEVDNFYNLNNPKIASLDGMPSVINHVLSFKIDDIRYQIRSYGGSITNMLRDAELCKMRLEEYGQKIINKHIKILEDYYNHLDKKCAIAKSLKITIDTIKTIQK